MPALMCERCGDAFELSPAVAKKYPGWSPKRCSSCHSGRSSGASNGAASLLNGLSDGPTSAGPKTGLFTDGSCSPNPGPGGWGAVLVKDDAVVAQAMGGADDTTNNRMELMAIIRGIELIPIGEATTVYSDSNLAVRTINEWAAGWKARNWTRKTGPIKNLDLIQELYAAFGDRPELTLKWIKAHVGQRWNEYADELANTGRTS